MMKVMVTFIAVYMMAAPLAVAEEKHPGMMGGGMPHGGMMDGKHPGHMSHEQMMEHCKGEMAAMNMPATTTKEQHEAMMNHCMEQAKQRQDEKKDGGK